MQGRHVNFATVSGAKSKQSKFKDASNKLRYKASEYKLQRPHAFHYNCAEFFWNFCRINFQNEAKISKFACSRHCFLGYYKQAAPSLIRSCRF